MFTCKVTNSYPGIDEVCEGVPSLTPNSFYINALGDSSPECNTNEKSSTLQDLVERGEKADACYLYCAQRSCDAAKEFAERESSSLSSVCDVVRYLPGGALEMKMEDLSDGSKCHAGIIEYNLSKGVKDGCLTCNEKRGEGVVYETGEEPPPWFERAGMYGPLPKQFTCDERYLSETPFPHYPSSFDSSLSVDLKASNLSDGGDKLVAYWAAEPSSAVVKAEDAYSSFSNSGIAYCKDSVCDFKFRSPGRYTSEGNVYKSHVHFTLWEGNKWSKKVRTLNLE